MGDFVTLKLTFGELTSLMHALELAKDEARKAVSLAADPRSPAWRPVNMELQEKQRNAAGQTYQNVTELCDLVTEAWQEARTDTRRDLLAAQ